MCPHGVGRDPAHLCRAPEALNASSKSEARVANRDGPHKKPCSAVVLNFTKTGAEKKPDTEIESLLSLDTPDSPKAPDELAKVRAQASEASAKRPARGIKPYRNEMPRGRRSVTHDRHLHQLACPCEYTHTCESISQSLTLTSPGRNALGATGSVT